MTGIHHSTTTAGSWVVIINDVIIADGLTYNDAMLTYSRIIFDRGNAAFERLAKGAQDHTRKGN